MSDTPLTDEQDVFGTVRRTRLVSIDFAQQLERDLATAQAKVKELEEQVLDITEDAVREQSLWYEQDDTFDSMAITSIQEKMEMLERHGRFEILKHHGRRVIGKFKEAR